MERSWYCKKKVTASTDGIPPIASIDKVKPLALEKVCPACGSDNDATAIACTNCGNNIAKFKAQPRQRQRDEAGAKPAQQPHETVMKGMPVTRMHVPGMPIAAQVLPPTKMIPTPNKPIKPKRLLSDDDVSVVDDAHMSNVEHSANHLGL